MNRTVGGALTVAIQNFQVLRPGVEIRTLVATNGQWTVTAGPALCKRGVSVAEVRHTLVQNRSAPKMPELLA